jgi:hypothetical protein
MKENKHTTRLHVHDKCVDLFDVLLYVAGAWGLGLVVGLLVTGN